MTRISPLPVSELAPDVGQLLQKAEAQMGFMPNDGLTMARDPQLLNAFAGMLAAVYRPGKVADTLKRLVGFMTSAGAGCTYCQAHARHGALRLGVPAEKLDVLWDFENSEQFSPAERAALRVALAAGQGQVDDPLYADFADHFGPDEQLEIVAVIALFGFLNRWNSTLSTTLEPAPAAAQAAPR